MNRHATEDFLSECMIGQKKVSEKDFGQQFCRVCKNQECHRAGWGESQWVQRMTTQVDRLLDNPTFADPRDPQYRQIREHDFPDLLKEAIRVEIIEQKGDWSIPSEVDVMTSVGAKGVQVLPELTPSSTTHEEETPKNGHPEKPSPIIHSELIVPQNNPSDSLTSEQAKPNPQINPQEKKGVSIYTNTPFPKEGLMIDGSSPVQRTNADQPSINPMGDPTVRQPSRFTLDSWSAPELSKPKNLVKKGARIQMGGTPSPNKGNPDDK